MLTQKLLDAIIAKLAQDFPDSDTLLSVEVFADWLAAYKRSVFEEYQPAPGLSPTGRRLSRPELQSLPDLIQADHVSIDDKGGISVSALGATRKFTYEQVMDKTPRHAEASALLASDDKGNVTWSDIRRGVFSSKGHPQNLPRSYQLPALDKTRRIAADPVLAAPYGKPWSQLTPDDIYKDISGMLLRQQADEEYNRRAVENGLQQEWVHLLNGRVSSYVPADQAGDAVFSTGHFEDGHMFVETMDKGKEAVTLARTYLLRLVNLELKV